MNLFAVISISILLSVFLPGGLALSGTGSAELYAGLPSQPLDDDMGDLEDDDGEEGFDDEDDEGEYYEDDDEDQEEDEEQSFDEWYEDEEGYDNGDQEDYGEYD